MPDPVDMNFVTTDVWGGSFLQWADTYTDVKDLVDKAIAKLKPGQCIRRLAIAGHGAEHTTGYFVFDPDTAGIETIDAGVKKNPCGPNVREQLARLKPYLCPDAIVEFRVCQSGTGENGTRFTQTVADIVGVPVTAPMASISSLALTGGVASDWKTAYPTSTGRPVEESFWRGEGTPPAREPVSDVAPVTGATVPLPSNRRADATPPTPPAPPAGRPRTGLKVAGAAAAVAVVAVGGMLVAGGGHDSSKNTTTSSSSSITTASSPTNAAPVAAANKPPVIDGLRASLAVPVTTYSVDAHDPEGDTLTFEWKMSGEQCGTPKVPWTQTTREARWSHSGQEPDACAHTGTDHNVTVSVTVSDAHGASVQCVIEGSETRRYDPALACLEG